MLYIIAQALGGTLLALGIYLKIEFRSLNDISDDNFSLWTYVLIGTTKANNLKSVHFEGIIFLPPKLLGGKY